jgi:hypothetical protein
LGFAAGIRNINKNSSFPFIFEFQNVDEQRNTVITITNTLPYFFPNSTNKPIGIQGPTTSENAAALHNIIAAPNKVPLISGVASATLLQSKQDFPYFMLVWPPNDLEVQAMDLFIRTFGNGHETVTLMTRQYFFFFLFSFHMFLFSRLIHLVSFFFLNKGIISMPNPFVLLSYN